MNHTYAAAFAVLAAGLPVAAQSCILHWDTTPGNPGIGNGYAGIMKAWNDGGGERLYVGGAYTQAAGSGANQYLSKWNPASNTWSPVGTGISGGFTNGFVAALVTYTPSGGSERLIAGGQWDTAGGVPSTASLAMWNGTTWQAMGTGWSGTTRGVINGMATWNGRLYVAGQPLNTPSLIAGLPWACLASWDGTTWQTHATSIVGSSPGISAVQVFNDGSGEALFAAGRFSSIDGVAGTSLIAKWNGTNWLPVGGGLTSTQSFFGLEAMTIFNDGTGPALYVAGYAFVGPGLPACNVAKWNGSTWTAVGGVVGTGRVTCLTSFDDGTGARLYLGGTAMVPISQIARFDSGSWQMLGGGVTGPALPTANFPSVFGLLPWQGKLFVGGSFTQVNNAAANGVAAWAGCPSCYADCDGVGGLTGNDFQCFLDRYIAGNSYADCDGAGGLTGNDFQCFLDKYVAGCT